MSSYVQVHNSGFVRDGSPVAIRGINLGCWQNIEAFMFGLQGIDSRIREHACRVLGKVGAQDFFDAYTRCFITGDDITFIKSIGMNCIRFPFNYRTFEDPRNPFSFPEERFAVMDQVVRWGREHELYVVLDFHAAPGGQNTTPPADNPLTGALLWTDRCYQDRCAALWKAIARRYRDEEWVLGYDLLNEPITENTDALNAVYHRLLQEIRSVDPHHVIIVESRVKSAGGAEGLDPGLFDDANTATSFHHYPCFRAQSYPGVADASDYRSRLFWDRTKLEESMAEDIAFARSVKRPMILGEFGFNRLGVLSVQQAVVNDLLATVTAAGGHWIMWSYKDIHKMGLLNPRPDTPWVRFCEREDIAAVIAATEASRKRHFDEVYIHQMGKNDGNRPVYDAAWNDEQQALWQLQLDFQLRELAQYSPQERLAMMDSWLFSNCAVNDWMLEVLRLYR